MRLGIVGSRRYPNMDAIRAYVDTLPKDTVIVTGGWPSLAGGYRVVEATAGVDRAAYTAAEAAGLVTVLVSGSKTKEQNMAGVQRNPVIVELSDAVVAFWDQTSRGTARTIQLTWAAGKNVVVVGRDGQTLVHADAHVQAALKVSGR